MKTMDILTDADLMTQYNQTKNFIARNSKKMGGRGRPRHFIRANVEAFLNNYHAPVPDAVIDASPAAAGVAQRRVIDGNLGKPVGPDEVGEVLGRGGRTRMQGRGDTERGAAA